MALDQPTRYLCTLYGLVSAAPFPPSSSPEPNTPSLPNLLSVLSAITDNASHHCEDIRHKRAREEETFTQLFSSMPQAEVKAARVLKQRQMKLRQIIPRVEARTFMTVERVYRPSTTDRHTLRDKNNSYSPCTNRTDIRAWREVIELHTEQWYVLSYSRPLVPVKHETYVRPVSCHLLTSSFVSSSEAESALHDYFSSLTPSYVQDYEIVKEGFIFAQKEPGAGTGTASTTATTSSSPSTDQAAANTLDDDMSVSAGSSADLQDVLLEVRVYHLLRLTRPGDLSSVDAVRGLHWVVELSGLANESNLYTVEERMTKLAKALEPLVKFSKLVPEH